MDVVSLSRVLQSMLSLGSEVVSFGAQKVTFGTLVAPNPAPWGTVEQSRVGVGIRDRDEICDFRWLSRRGPKLRNHGRLGVVLLILGPMQEYKGMRKNQDANCENTKIKAATLSHSDRETRIQARGKLLQLGGLSNEGSADFSPGGTLEELRVYI